MLYAWINFINSLAFLYLPKLIVLSSTEINWETLEKRAWGSFNKLPVSLVESQQLSDTFSDLSNEIRTVWRRFDWQISDFCGKNLINYVQLLSERLAKWIAVRGSKIIFLSIFLLSCLKKINIYSFVYANLLNDHRHWVPKTMTMDNSLAYDWY